MIGSAPKPPDGAKPFVVLAPRELEFVASELDNAYRVIRLWEDPFSPSLTEARTLICLGHQSPFNLIKRLPQLQLIACFTTGYDALDVEALNARGVQVSHAPGATAEPVAEFALALILASYRNVVRGALQIRSGDWVKGRSPPIGQSIQGKRIGIVGLGAIGTALAIRCEALKMEVRWWGPNPKPEAPWIRASSLEELARATDILAICSSANPRNTGLISSTVIDAVGPDGLLVNVARGQLIDEAALIDALKSGRLGGAALDVFEVEPTPSDKWEDVPNVLCTPHIAGSSSQGLTEMTAMLRANLDAFYAGRPIPYPAQ